MTILPDYALRRWAANGGLTPFDEALINPASVDLRWSGRYRETLGGDWSLVRECRDLSIKPGHMYLLDTLEVIRMPEDCCAMIMLKSSLGRRGLEHMHAGFFDPGFCGTATLEMYGAAPWPITISVGQPLVQIIMMLMTNVPERLYAGRYQGDMMPMPNKEDAHAQ